MNRRAFLETMCLGGPATFGRPRVTFPQVQQTGRLVFVLLRGGLDGLALSRRAATRPIGRFADRWPSKTAISGPSTACSVCRPASRRYARRGIATSSWFCTRWRSHSARAATSTARRFSRPASIVPKSRPRVG
jgi:hypothetical protein